MPPFSKVHSFPSPFFLGGEEEERERERERDWEKERERDYFDYSDEGDRENSPFSACLDEQLSSRFFLNDRGGGGGKEEKEDKSGVAGEMMSKEPLVARLPPIEIEHQKRYFKSISRTAKKNSHFLQKDLQDQR